jgi:hypothetical protein
MSLDDEIDALYQLPPAEFTPARNALLKRAPAGADKARVRALQKPVAAAWGVNQLYWQRRKVFDRLMSAAIRVREAHAQQLAGQRADVSAAEKAHQDVMRDASDQIRELLRGAGDAASPATMIAVGETLQALPGRDDHGRLVKPLKPLGFEALAGLVRGGGTIAPFVPRRGQAEQEAPAAPVAAPSRAPSRAEREAEKKAAAERRTRLAGAERELRDVQAHEREAQTALSRAEMTLARLQRERRAVQEQLDDLIARADELTAQMGTLRKDVERAAQDRTRVEDVVSGLRDD